MEKALKVNTQRRRSRRLELAARRGRWIARVLPHKDYYPAGATARRTSRAKLYGVKFGDDAFGGQDAYRWKLRDQPPPGREGRGRPSSHRIE